MTSVYSHHAAVAMVTFSVILKVCFKSKINLMVSLVQFFVKNYV